MKDIIIIGTGMAGYTLARELRKHDQQSTLLLISRDDGAYYSKPMLSNALDKDKTADTLIISDADKMATDLDATIWNHTDVTHIDAENHQIQCDRGAIEYKHLILACGANPIKIPFEGDAADTIMSVNNLDDYRHFRTALEKQKRIVIIGAGLIGCEFANDLSTSDITIDIVDLAPQALGRLLPAGAAKELQNRLLSKGVNWHLDNAVSSVNHKEGVLEVKLKSGEIIDTDIVLSAIGLRASLQLANTAGLEVERGIKVDRHLKTSQDDIYALGDCAQVEDLNLPFVMPLMNAARALAASLAGNKTAVNYPAMPVVVKTPIYPIVVCPPPRPVEGQWEEEVTETGIRAKFKDTQGTLQGFALTGELVKERMLMAKEVPDWLS